MEILSLIHIFGYAGGGELWIKSTPTPDANDNGKIKGADDAGVAESSDYAEKYENYTKVYTFCLLYTSK